VRTAQAAWLCSRTGEGPLQAAACRVQSASRNRRPAENYKTGWRAERILTALDPAISIILNITVRMACQRQGLRGGVACGQSSREPSAEAEGGWFCSLAGVQRQQPAHAGNYLG
jgi:hypothetical protein